MIYLLYGVKTLIDSYIDKIKKKEKIEDINISKYSVDDNIENIIEDASTISLFDSKKLIIVENELLFNGKKTIDTSNLENYISNYNPNTILIFISYSDTIDSRKKLFKLINDKGKVEKLNQINNINDYIKTLFKD